MKSKYAEYFDIQRVMDQESRAICLTCGVTLTMPNRSTSALKYHIETKHGIFLTAKSESEEIIFEPKSSNVDDHEINIEESAKSEIDEIILEPTKSSNNEQHEMSYNDEDYKSNKNWKTSKSKYAEYFDIQPEENRATCLTCGAVLNMTNRNTSTLKYHVETKHGINIEEAKSESDEIILVPKSEKDEHEMPSYDEDYKSQKPRKISKSKYAEYFDIQPEENQATCLSCGAVLNMTNRSTSALKYHIEIKHNIFYLPVFPAFFGHVLHVLGQCFFTFLYLQITLG